MTIVRQCDWIDMKGQRCPDTATGAIINYQYLPHDHYLCPTHFVYWKQHSTFPLRSYVLY